METRPILWWISLPQQRAVLPAVKPSAVFRRLRICMNRIAQLQSERRSPAPLEPCCACGTKMPRTMFPQILGACLVTCFCTVTVQATAPMACGDFNQDGVVNNADLLIWSKDFGKVALPISSDGDADGDADGHDFLCWQSHYGLGQVVQVIPEPSGLLQALLAATVAHGHVARRRHELSRRDRR